MDNINNCNKYYELYVNFSYTYNNNNDDDNFYYDFIIFMFHLLTVKNPLKNENIDYKYIEQCFYDSLRKNYQLQKLYDMYLNKSEEDIIETIKYFIKIFENDEKINTPYSIIKLSLNLLNIKEKETVLDIGSGFGNFLLSSYEQNANAIYNGIEINKRYQIISQIKTVLSNANINLECDDIILFLKKYKNTYDKIFFNYPLGIKFNLNKKLDILDNILYGASYFYKGISTDWIYNLIMTKLLSNRGKAIGIMTSSNLINKRDERIRQFFIKEKLIESIILLPDKLLNQDNTALIVFSKNNDNIRMIDARKIYHKCNKMNVFEKSDIENIISKLNVDSTLSKNICLDDIKNNDNISLNPLTYLNKKILIKDGVKLKSFLEVDIHRGALIPANEINEYKTNDTTKYQYLTLSDINDFQINENLQNLVNLKDEYKKYIVKEGDLILSKNGAPFKCAVVDNSNSCIIASGNLYVIKLDQSKINPYYLQAFLVSDIGQQILLNESVGATLKNISVKALNNIDIPFTPLNEQVKVANCFRKKLNEIRLLNKKIENNKKELLKFF